MSPLQILKLAETLLNTLKGTDKIAAIGALRVAIDAITADQSTVAILD